MDARTASGVEYKRRAAEEEIEAALKAATEAEMAEAAAAEEAGIDRPTAKERFSALGKRIIALADGHLPIKSNGYYAGERYKGWTELGTEGLAISTEAREAYTPGSLRGRELDYLDVQWLSSAYVADTPLIREEVGVSMVQPNNITPEVFGLLRLMEQSLSVVELARQATTPAQTQSK